MNLSSYTLLYLLRISLGTESGVRDLSVLTVKDWTNLIDVAFDHGVATLSVDGYSQILPTCKTNLLETDEALDDLKFEWFGSILQTEDEYNYNFNKAVRFAQALHEKGIECKVLKGISFSTYYTIPNHRESGDCDVFLGKGFELGNKLAQEIGGRYEFGTYKHSHLFFGNLMVENHRYLTDFGATSQGKKIEILLENAIESEPGRRIGDSFLVCPNDHFNALFLLKHAQGNFIGGGLTLRMIYDWAALLLRCQETLNWQQLYDELGQCRLRKFADLMTSLSVDYFGVQLSRPEISTCSERALVEEVIADTIAGGIHSKGPESFPRKCVRIFRRFLRFWHYRALATESVPRLIWNTLAFSSYLNRKIEL